MDVWEKSNEIKLHEKENFYSHLNMDDITDAKRIYNEKIRR